MLAASVQLPNTEQLPSAPTPQNWCGVGDGMQQARQHMTDGQDQQAVQILKDVLEFAPAETAAWHLLADILQQHGLNKKSTACRDKALLLEQSIENEKNELPASERLAKLLWAQGDKDAAQTMLTTLLERQPALEALLILKQSWRQSLGSTHS
ncbi:MAG: alkyl sulfatase dimerization domain-containing protein [Mariprofundaceae bacterium]